MRDSCIFYRSFYESIKELPAESRAVLYDAIFSYSLDFVEPELSGLDKSIFTLIKPQLDANIKRYNNGLIPKVKQDESKPEAKDKQNKSKPEANVNVNDNDNVNLNVNENNNLNENKEKITDFKKSVQVSSNCNFQLKEIFCKFYLETRGTEYLWEDKDWGKTKSLAIKLLKKSKEKKKDIAPEKETETIIAAFEYLLSQIKDPWILSNLSMSIIDSRFNEIINQILNPIKNGKQSVKEFNDQASRQLLSDIANGKF